MAAETQYSANTGIGVLTTGNSSLTGSGTVGTDLINVITGASNGTLVKSVIVKARGTTTQGMVRLFVYNGTNTRLISEVEVPAVTQNSEDPAFEVYLETNFALKSGHILRATTQNSETFHVIAEGLDWTYYATSVRPESANYTGNSGMVNMATGNTSLTGSGTLGTDIFDLLDAGVSASGWKGCSISAVHVKATATTTPGMVRLFINDGTNTRLLSEIPVRNATPATTVRSFSAKLDFNGNGFMLQPGYKIYATTHNSESINVIAEASDWKYPA